MPCRIYRTIVPARLSTEEFIWRLCRNCLTHNDSSIAIIEMSQLQHRGLFGTSYVLGNYKWSTTIVTALQQWIERVDNLPYYVFSI